MFVVFFSPFFSSSQIANYVNNGGFEELYDCQFPSIISQAKYWNGVDSLSGGWSYLASSCYSNVPQNGAGFQWPKSGNAYIRSGFFCPPPTCSSELNRLYLKNRMKKKLQANKTYCVKFYVNIFNPSTYGMDGFAAYFGDNTLDTITKFGIPLTYLTPQVQNPNNNIITDTLNWTLITGTFVATGTEKLMLIGNFKSDAATNKVLIDPTSLPSIFTDVCIDHVSCIDIDLPAFAGRDTSVLAGDSIYIGRESDVGIDEACFWYQLPTIITPTTAAIDTVAGFWIKPLINCAYVVRQEICGNVKFDTVRIYMNPVGLEKLKLLTEELKIYPVPASDFIELRSSNPQFFSEFKTVAIYNSFGQSMKEEVLRQAQQTDGVFRIRTDDLSSGLYFVTLIKPNKERVTKKLIISK